MMTGIAISKTGDRLTDAFGNASSNGLNPKADTKTIEPSVYISLRVTPDEKAQLQRDAAVSVVRFFGAKGCLN